MLQPEDEARVAALQELASRLYRNLDMRDGRAYWRNNAPRALRAWVMDLHRQSPYTRSDMHELYHALYELCGLVLDSTDCPGRVATQDIADAVARSGWADPDHADLLRWLRDDVSRIALVDAHLESGSVLAAARLGQENFRRDMAHALLAALERRAAGEQAAWAVV